VVEIKFNLLGIIYGINHELPIRAWPKCKFCIETDGGWHDESIVVIGVLADQIDASRSLVNTWRCSKTLDESLCEVMDPIAEG
jgi:hypothetical protein